MDNAQKAIMIGVGLFITIIIISAVLLVVNIGTGMMDSATSELGSMTAGLQANILSQYDGKTMTGSNLLAGIRNYANSDNMCITVFNTDKTIADAVTGNVIQRYGAKKLDFSDVEGVTWETLTSDDFKTGGFTGADVVEYADGEKKQYSDASEFIVPTKYYRTAVVYDTEGKLLGFVAIQKKK